MNDHETSPSAQCINMPFVKTIDPSTDWHLSNKAAALGLASTELAWATENENPRKISRYLFWSYLVYPKSGVYYAYCTVSINNSWNANDFFGGLAIWMKISSVYQLCVLALEETHLCRSSQMILQIDQINLIFEYDTLFGPQSVHGGSVVNLH